MPGILAAWVWYESDSLRTTIPTAEETSPITSKGVMPSLEEARELVPPEDGITWRLAGDARILGSAGYALLLQVTHPVVGAGVSEHSNFRADPWGRLLRTLDYTSSTVYGGPRLALEIGTRVREMHKQIKGVLPNGERYHALEPKAYAWVHATLGEAIVRGHENFGSPLSEAELEEFWTEWRPIGRLVGVRERDLPETWAEFVPYFERTVDEVLESTDAAHEVLESLQEPTPPPIPWMREPMWRAISWPSTKAGTIGTVGMLPPVLRRRLGIGWTERDQRTFERLGAISRRTRPLMPKTMRCFGPSYLKWRREAIARGDVASGSGGPTKKPAPAAA